MDIRDITYVPKTSEVAFRREDEFVHERVRIKRFRFISARLQQGDVDTYGIYACPEGDVPEGGFPGILHIHGGGQTASPENVAYWVKQGYACMSFDWTGRTDDRDEALVTHHPAGVEEEVPAYIAKHQYLGVFAARTCISLLSELHEVDANRIGIYGISWGGFITWIVNALDSRVKCAMPIYGAGGLFLNMHMGSRKWVGASEEDRAFWMRTFEPMTYAHRQQSPVYHINGSNDFFGAFDTLSDMLYTVPTDLRVDLMANANHHISGGSARTADAWFAHYLKGAPPLPPLPKVRLTDCEKGTFTVVCENVTDATDLWISEGDARHYTRAYARKNAWKTREDGTKAMTLSVTGDAWLFVKTYYEDGTSLSSIPLCVAMPSAPATPNPHIFEAGNVDGVGYRMGTEIMNAGDITELFRIDKKGLRPKEEGGALDCLMFYTPSSDGSRAWKEKDAIALEIFGAERLTVQTGWDDWHFSPKKYNATFTTPPDGELILTPSMFVDGDGEVLASFDDVEFFSFPSSTSRKGSTIRIAGMRRVTR